MIWFSSSALTATGGKQEIEYLFRAHIEPIFMIKRGRSDQGIEQERERENMLSASSKISQHKWSKGKQQQSFPEPRQQIFLPHVSGYSQVNLPLRNTMSTISILSGKRSCLLSGETLYTRTRGNSLFSSDTGFRYPVQKPIQYLMVFQGELMIA